MPKQEIDCFVCRKGALLPIVSHPKWWGCTHCTFASDRKYLEMCGIPQGVLDAR